MGKIFSTQKSVYDVILLGLPGAGKTHLLCNTYLDDGWYAQYKKGPQEKVEGDEDALYGNTIRAENLGLLPRYIALAPTLGFN